MRKMEALVKDLEEERRETVEKVFDLEVENWRNFLVFKEYEEICKKMLDKLMTWYFRDLTKLVPNGRIKIAVSKDPFEGEEEAKVLPMTEKNTRIILIPVLKEDRKELGLKN